jgi:hypothetical protein
MIDQGRLMVSVSVSSQFVHLHVQEHSAILILSFTSSIPFSELNFEPKLRLNWVGAFYDTTVLTLAFVLLPPFSPLRLCWE